MSGWDDLFVQALWDCENLDTGSGNEIVGCGDYSLATMLVHLEIGSIKYLECMKLGFQGSGKRSLGLHWDNLCEKLIG
jgi:hypothetical protein